MPAVAYGFARQATNGPYRVDHLVLMQKTEASFFVMSVVVNVCPSLTVSGDCRCRAFGRLIFFL